MCWAGWSSGDRLPRAAARRGRCRRFLLLDQLVLSGEEWYRAPNVAFALSDIMCRSVPGNVLIELKMFNFFSFRYCSRMWNNFLTGAFFQQFANVICNLFSGNTFQKKLSCSNWFQFIFLNNWIRLLVFSYFVFSKMFDVKYEKIWIFCYEKFLESNYIVISLTNSPKILLILLTFFKNC